MRSAPPAEFDEELPALDEEPPELIEELPEPPALEDEAFIFRSVPPDGL